MAIGRGWGDLPIRELLQMFVLCLEYQLPLNQTHQPGGGRERITMSKYAGTQTEKNLEAAFAGESQARNKYTYFASKAKKEGFEQIAALFLKTADNEKDSYSL